MESTWILRLQKAADSNLLKDFEHCGCDQQTNHKSWVSVNSIIFQLIWSINLPTKLQTVSSPKMTDIASLIGSNPARVLSFGPSLQIKSWDWNAINYFKMIFCPRKLKMLYDSGYILYFITCLVYQNIRSDHLIVLYFNFFKTNSFVEA